MTEFLLPRDVAALFPSGREANWEGYLSVDTATEYRIMGDRNHETGAVAHADGTYASMDWFQYGDPVVRWTTNSLHAIVTDATRRAPNYTWMNWAHPLTLETPRRLPPGFERTDARGRTTITWDDGAHWMWCAGREPTSSLLEVASFWVPYTVEEIVESMTNPPGPIGMVERNSRR